MQDAKNDEVARDSPFDRAEAGVQRFLTKADTVSEWLRIQILSGVLQPGTRLRQEEIAARVGVSSTPVREAFGVLEAEGLVEREPHRGVVVSRRDATDLEELTEVRALVEELAIRRIARRAPEASLGQIERTLAESNAAIQGGSIQAFRLASRNFHAALIRASGSAPLEDLYAVIVARPILYAPLDEKGMVRAHRTHAQILSAIKRGDSERAITLISQHHHWYERGRSSMKAHRAESTESAR